MWPCWGHVTLWRHSPGAPDTQCPLLAKWGIRRGAEKGGAVTAHFATSYSTFLIMSGGVLDSMGLHRLNWIPIKTKWWLVWELLLLLLLLSIWWGWWCCWYGGGKSLTRFWYLWCHKAQYCTHCSGCVRKTPWSMINIIELVMDVSMDGLMKLPSNIAAQGIEPGSSGWSLGCSPLSYSPRPKLSLFNIFLETNKPMLEIIVSLSVLTS